MRQIVIASLAITLLALAPMVIEYDHESVIQEIASESQSNLARQLLLVARQSVAGGTCDALPIGGLRNCCRDAVEPMDCPVCCNDEAFECHIGCSYLDGWENWECHAECDARENHCTMWCNMCSP